MVETVPVRESTKEYIEEKLQGKDVGIVNGSLMVQGGGEEVLRKSAVAFDADVYTMAYDPQRFDQDFRDDIEHRITKIVHNDADGEEFEGLEHRFDDGFLLQGTLTSAINDMMSRADVDMIDNDVLIAMDTEGSIICYHTGRPYATYLHHPAKVFTDYFWDMMDKDAPITSKARRVITKWSYTRGVKKAVKGSGAIMANSERVRQRTNEVWSIPVEDMDLVYPPVDTDVFTPGEPTEDILHDLDRYFITPQRLEAYKNVHVLIEAAKKAREHVVITGTGTLESYARREAQYSDYVHALGFMSRGELVDLYRGAEASLQGSMREDFGIVPVESMACGTPCILPASGGYLETVGNGYEQVRKKDLKTGRGYLIAAQDYGYERLAEVLSDFDKDDYDEEEMVRKAWPFNRDRFAREVADSLASIDYE